MAKKNSPPYWLAGGAELCDLCEHPHVLEAGYRCVACDRAACEHCVMLVDETGEVLCHECRDAEKEENG